MRHAGSIDYDRQEVEMKLKFAVYVYADGPKFDIVKFNESLPRELRGQVRPVSRMKEGVKETVGYFWYSKKLSVWGSEVEVSLIRLLSRYESSLRRARRMGAKRIYAMIASQGGEARYLSGFHFRADQLKVLTRMGAELSISLTYPGD